MERGPMALFGAIVAVGLGPAMWLGAQLGAMGAVPSRPPAVTSEQQANGAAPTQQKGGEAGSAPEDPSVVLQTKSRANHRPVDSRRSPSPSASSSATEKPDPDHTTTEPTKATTSPSPSADPSTPTESTSEPSDPPTVPPSPPPSSEPDSSFNRV